MSIPRFFQGWQQREILTVLGIAILSLVLWRVPYIGLLFYPFHLFSTFVHEICHGFAAILTGGQFQRFVIHADFSGIATYRGGIRWIVTSAGYIGTTLFGSILMIISAKGVSSRMVIFVLASALTLLTLFYVRNFFGILSGIVLAAMLFIAQRTLSIVWTDRLLLFLAIQSLLDALNSVFDLVSLSTFHRGTLTDAQIMQNQTYIPALFWALLWSGISIGVLMMSLMFAYRRSTI